MMEAEAAAEEDQTHGPGKGYLWIVSSSPQAPLASDDDAQEPLRLWFEITTFCLQWRPSPRSEQHTTGRIVFSDVTQVAPVGSSNLRIATLTSTLQLKAPTRDVRNMWLRSLGDAVFCSGRPPGASPIDILHECIDTNDITYLRHLLSTNPSLIPSVDDEGNSLLLQACKRGASIEFHQTLLQFGADPHIVNFEEESPLVLAAASGVLDLVRLFIESGHVHVNQRCASGITAVLAAASTGQTPCLQLLFDCGGDVVSVDDRGWSALHYSAACPRGVEAVTWLCEAAPALVQWPAHQDGHTPLHVAARFGYDDIVYVLLQFGASVEATNHDMETPLQVSMKNGHVTATAMLQAMAPLAMETYVDERPEGNQGVVQYDEHDEAGRAMMYHPQNAVEESIAQAWVPCTTEDGQAYFYNTVTFESVWELPDNAIYGPVAEHQEVLSDDGRTAAPPSGELPICMVPTICPLYEMDNPDVHAKEMMRRKREREMRRSSRSKLVPKSTATR